MLAKSRSIVVVALVLLGVPIVAPMAQTRGLPPGAIHVDRAEIVDATGFEAPMAASTLFLPRGWQTQGGVYWASEFMCTNGYNFIWSAASPDGMTSVHVLPQERWETNNGATCGNVRVLGEEERLEAALLHHAREGHRIDGLVGGEHRDGELHRPGLLPRPRTAERTALAVLSSATLPQSTSLPNLPPCNAYVFPESPHRFPTIAISIRDAVKTPPRDVWPHFAGLGAD